MGSLHRIEGAAGGLRLVAAPAPVRGRGRWVLVPAADVVLTAVDLPGVARSAWPRAVPFALEDRLSEAVDALHFALAPGTAPGTAPGAASVAVVARAQMERWLAACAEAGVRPNVMLPNVLALPWAGPGAASILLSDDAALVRTGTCGGFATEPDALGTYLAAWRTGAGETGAVDLYDARTGAAAGAVPEAIARVGAVREHVRVGDVAAWLAEQLPPRPALNLRQGAFAAPVPWWRPSWAAAAALLALWIAAQSLVGVLETHRLQAEADRLGLRLGALLEPGARPPGTGAGELERRVRRMLLAASRPAPDFLGLLTLSAPVLAEVQPLAIERLTYEDERIVIELRLGSSGVLDGLLARLRERGFAVEVLSLVNREGSVESRIRLGTAR